MHRGRFWETLLLFKPTSVPCLTAASCDCQREHTEWDKLFIMLENSQMKENMMLQALEDGLKADVQAIRAELNQLTAGLAGTFSSTVQQLTSHALAQLEQAQQRNGDQPEDAERLCESQQGKVLEQVLQLSHNVSARLGQLESSWLRWAEREAQETAFQLQQDKLGHSREDNLLLNTLWKELQQTRSELKASQKWASQHLLPAGECSAGRFTDGFFRGPNRCSVNAFLLIGLQSSLMGSPEALSRL